MIKLIFHPQESNFRLLQIFGTLLVAGAVLVLVIALISGITVFLPIGGMGISLSAMIRMLYALPFLLLSGHLLHWVVAMWEAKQESNEILIELRKGLQKNNAFKCTPSEPDT